MNSEEQSKQSKQTKLTRKGFGTKYETFSRMSTSVSNEKFVWEAFGVGMMNVCRILKDEAAVDRFKLNQEVWKMRKEWLLNTINKSEC